MVDDRRLDDHARLELLLHRAPLALEAGAAQGQDRVALLRLGLEDVDEDGVADRQLGLRLGVAAVELAVADDAFGLGPDVDEDLVLVDPDDRALDDVAVLEALDVRVLLGEQLLHRRRLGTEVARRGAGLGSSSSSAAGRIGGVVGAQRSSGGSGIVAVVGDGRVADGVAGALGLGASAPALGLGERRRRRRARPPRRRARRLAAVALVGRGGVGGGGSATASAASVPRRSPRLGASASASAAPRRAALVGRLGGGGLVGDGGRGGGSVGGLVRVEALASGWTGPSCCSSVKVWSLLSVKSPDMTTAWAAPRPGPETIRGGPW